MHRQLRFLLKREESYIAKLKKLEKEEEAMEAEVLSFPDDVPAKEKPEHVMFRRLKVLMVYHSITTVSIAAKHYTQSHSHTNTRKPTKIK